MPPLGREHDEVERERRLDLQPAPASPAGLVRCSERLHQHALVTLGQRGGEEPLGFLRVGGHEPGHAHRLREHRLERREPLSGGAVEQVVAVEVEAVEEDRRERDRPSQLVDVELAAEAAHRHLERPWPAAVVERDRLAVEDEGFDRELPNRLDELGHAGGDVGQVARVDAHVAGEPVHLDSRAVELPFDGGRSRAGRARRRCSRPSARASAASGRKSVEPEAREPGSPSAIAAAATAPRSPLSISARRTAPRRDPRSLRDRVDHHAREGALPQLAAQQAGEEALLGLGRAGEQLPEQPAPERL